MQIEEVGLLCDASMLFMWSVGVKYRSSVSSQVFKILVRKTPDESWVVFRRYTDFSRLNDKVGSLSMPGSTSIWAACPRRPRDLSDRDLFADTLLSSLIRAAQRCPVFPTQLPTGCRQPGKQRSGHYRHVPYARGGGSGIGRKPCKLFKLP